MVGDFFLWEIKDGMMKEDEEGKGRRNHGMFQEPLFERLILCISACCDTCSQPYSGGGEMLTDSFVKTDHEGGALLPPPSSLLVNRQTHVCNC